MQSGIMHILNIVLDHWVLHAYSKSAITVHSINTAETEHVVHAILLFWTCPHKHTLMAAMQR